MYCQYVYFRLLDSTGITGPSGSETLFVYISYQHNHIIIILLTYRLYHLRDGGGEKILQNISEYKHLVYKIFQSTNTQFTKYFRVQTPFLQNISEYKHLFYKIFQSTNTLFTKYFKVQTLCLQNCIRNFSCYKH